MVRTPSGAAIMEAVKVSRRTWFAVAVLSLCGQGGMEGQTIPKGSGPPVVLINGWQALCTATNGGNAITDAQPYFGSLAAFLGNSGFNVLFFNTCQYGDVAIETIAANFSGFLAGLAYDDGTAVNQVDIVAHGMGGLVARAYLAGKSQTSGSFAPPINSKVRRLVLIATPNFGSFQADINHGIQETQMVPGSQFSWDLATWNQNQDDLRGTDALAIVGNAGTWGGSSNGSDGYVSLTSASLGFARTDIRTRVVPYCHVTSATVPASFPLSCQGQGIASVDSQSHLTFQILLAFLSGLPNWQTVGLPPSQDNFLGQNGGIGGVILTLKASDDTYFKDLISAGYDCIGTRCSGHLGSGPSSAVASVYYNEVVQLGQRTFVMTHGDGSSTAQAATVVSGGTKAFSLKLGPVITGVQSSVSTGLPGLTVSGNSTITVTGSGFMSTASTQLFANGTALAVSQVSDTQITAFLPGNYNGLVQLKVVNGNGQHTVNMFTASASPVITITSVLNGGSGAPGAIAPGEIVSIKGSLLGPATGVSFAINSAGKVDTTLGGVQVHFGDFAAPLTYASATQINAIVPYEVASQAQLAMRVDYQGLSASTNLQVANAAPGAFTFNATGTGQVIAANLSNGTFNGPSSPAPKGSFVTIYFTGGGITNPAGSTGSVNSGSVLKKLLQDVFVTVGGRTADVPFAGAAPTLVDGVLQLNIQLDPATPSGSAQPLIIRVGGVVSPSTATLAVQ